MLLSIPLVARLAVQYHVLELSTTTLSEASELEDFLIGHLIPDPVAKPNQAPLREEPLGTRFSGTARRYAENRYWLSVNTKGRVTGMPCCRIEWRFKGWQYPDFVTTDRRDAWAAALRLAALRLSDIELGKVWDSHRRVRSYRERPPVSAPDFERIGRIVRRRAAYGETGISSPHNLLAQFGKYTSDAIPILSSR